MNNPELIAHVRKNKDGTWANPQPLIDHLEGSAKLASRFAEAFNSASWAYAAGFTHDIGKAASIWQHYLRVKSGYDDEAHLEIKAGKQDHSSPSAKFVEEQFGKATGRILSYCIAGHHSGLPDWIGSPSSLSFRLQNIKTCSIPEEYRKDPRFSGSFVPPWKFDNRSLDMSLWIRMIFSCIVDADFLDTESYMEPDNKKTRGDYLSLAELLIQFNSYMDKMIKKTIEEENTIVNQARQKILVECRSAAKSKAGFFSLTVPTGGGKTLSSMAFALEHAAKFGKERIIYVIPYTSIIEQNADVFRKVLGEEQVIEHHSNLDENDSNPKSRLAAENWDAPIIVTTSVQFFESLFAAKPSRCRKLHNIVNSVVVLDEAQLIPTGYLEPILATMKLLCEHYKVTFVLCTATQPAFEAQDDYPQFPGLPRGSVREIIQDVPRLYRELRRVEVDPVDTNTTRRWEEIAEELKSFERVLCVVSDRRSCRELHALMPKGTYHLSALMCAQHRSDCIAEIKERLKTTEPVRVISTQLVEAGVDIDFPVVYRAMAGLDSIAQSAGRCNREGKLKTNGGLGKVVVFTPQRKPPAGILRKASETTARLLDSGLKDPIDHAAFSQYFSELYWKVNSLDEKGIMKMLSPDMQDCGIQFRSAAEAFHIIDDAMQKTVLVPYGEGEKFIAELKAKGPERWLLRKLQRYSVTIYNDQFYALLNRGSIEEVSPGLFALTCKIEYDDVVGLLIDEMPNDPKSFIAI
ncbi:MAG TPA: CRISPR-associated helicase Cas3' [Rectinema sp.]|nr:CRISPR-associated helicase Cas3' [Rectinema sp.]HOR91959.1 CRISPR-associated helicase Cas3' [Rectinema sp.]HPK79916.1 CRISPR-associated helicase Cas3' [Rectinema sp.]HQG15553.1 CRISPR-associated helicase Cas3' [Rectinema sp.]HQH88461.1 CRISPR-associated helicase Cas3' [Rectinema sp.]